MMRRDTNTLIQPMIERELVAADSPAVAALHERLSSSGLVREKRARAELTQAQAREIAALILHDVAGRGGFRDIFEEISPEHQQKIQEQWATIIRRKGNFFVRHAGKEKEKGAPS